MNLGTLDLSMWPPALVWSLLVIVLVCHVLPDAIALTPRASASTAPTSAVPSASILRRSGKRTQA